MINDINRHLSRRGYNRIKQDHSQKIQQWLSFYRGNVDGFHTFDRKLAKGYETVMKYHTADIRAKELLSWLEVEK